MQRGFKRTVIGQSTLVLGIFLSTLGIGAEPLWGVPLPPVEDIPEEVIQIEISEEAASVFNGEVIPSAIDAQQRDALRIREEDLSARLAPEIHQLIFLLRVRSVMRGLLPFL